MAGPDVPPKVGTSATAAMGGHASPLSPLSPLGWWP
jgi:hypothetical protein